MNDVGIFISLKKYSLGDSPILYYCPVYRKGNVLFGMWVLLIIIITISYGHFVRSGREEEI